MGKIDREHISKMHDILDNIDQEIIKDYAIDVFDLVEESEADIEDFDTDDLVDELQDRNYNFLEESDTDELIDELNRRGYYVGDSYEKMSITDSMNTEELVDGFRELDFEKQQLVLRMVAKLNE